MPTEDARRGVRRLVFFQDRGSGPWHTRVAFAVLGLGFSGMGALISLTVSEAFGSIMGLVGTVGIFRQLAGRVVAGVPLDATDSYTLAFTIIAALYLA